MGFILVASTVSVIVGAVVALVISSALKRMTAPWRLNTYRICLALSLVPFALNVSYVFDQSASWTDFNTSEPFRLYPVFAFVGVSILLGLGLLGISMGMARRLPLLSAFLPAAVFTSYFHLAFKFLRWRAPDWGPLIDNVPMVWLFIHEAGATAFLFVLAWRSLAGRSKLA